MKRIVTSLLWSLTAACYFGYPASVGAAELTKVVFISGNPSHGPMSHEHRAGNMHGVKPFSVNDEWDYHMRFVTDMKGVTPILSDLPGPETLTRPNGPRSGNPAVRRAVANGERQHVAWAYERPAGKGRGFGFTGAHHHLSWQNDGFRTIVLNAILWTAERDVPGNGVPSATPTDAEMRMNLDDKKK